MNQILDLALSLVGGVWWCGSDRTKEWRYNSTACSVVVVHISMATLLLNKTLRLYKQQQAQLLGSLERNAHPPAERPSGASVLVVGCVVVGCVVVEAAVKAEEERHSKTGFHS